MIIRKKIVLKTLIERRSKVKIKSIINKLKYWKKTTLEDDTQEQTTTDSNFTTLAPKILEGKSLEENKIYLEALKEAVQIPENKNIALMGAYGSGKSSIMKTFEKNNPNHKYLFLSLASFFEKEEVEDESLKNTENQIEKLNIDPNDGMPELHPVNNLRKNNNKIETWEKVEKILVKQMIYRGTTKQLPYSRFKRISQIPNLTLLFHAVLIFILIDLLTNQNIIVNLYNSLFTVNAIVYGIIFVLGLYFIYVILLQLAKTLKLSKFSFNSITIETSEDETSYFSKYLDEIIYYFEVSKTEIVVIEDIDRFNSITVFEHLRELNYLLNNSNQIKQRVRFIYAVRDDLFNYEGESYLKESEEYLRTKFFDFIIPVIPVVDYNNSRNFLVPKVKTIIENNFSDNKVTDAYVKNKDKGIVFNIEIERFLWSISIYIDDLRLIYNICNEFEIYIKKLSHLDTINDLIKLFSLIVYKNIYPEDFASLQRNNGKLYEVFHSIKNTILDGVKNEINNKIKRERDILNGSNYEVSMSARTAIFQMCLREFGKEINPSSVTYNKDNKNNFSGTNVIPLTDSTINNFLSAENFIELKYGNKRIEVPKEKIEKYFNRFGVRTNGVIRELKEQERKERERSIEQLEMEKNFIKAIPVKEIFENEYDGYSNITGNFEEYNLLIKYLISEGYIDETYNYYISNLYEDVLGTNDITIIQKIKSNTSLDDTEELNDYELAILELSESDYRKTAILNQKIILYIFNDFKYETEQRSMINTFIYKLDNNRKTKLLQELFEQSHNQIKRFVSLLLQENSKIYSDLYKNEATDTEFNKLLEYYIFGSSENELLQQVIDDNPMLQPNVEDIPNFVLNLYGDFDVNEIELNVFFADNIFKFKETGLSEMSDNYFKHYVNNHLYQINTTNVFDIYERITSKSQEYFSLSELLASELEGLTQHINENFDEYIQLLNGRESFYEEGNILIRILNESEVSKALKNDIIKNNNSIIDDVTAINDAEHRRNVFEYEKYDTCLKNVMKATDEEINYISPYFEDESMVKQFIDEASDMSELEDNFIEELQSFLIMLVNESGKEVNEINIELFKYVDEYTVDNINDRTFNILLDCERIKPTIENINKLSGKKKIKLMTEDETTVSEKFQSIKLNDEEIINGISVFGDELREKLIMRSFKNDKLIVLNKVEWLKEILNQKIELNAVQINNLFSYDEILQDSTILEYLVFVIPKNILTESDLLRNIYSIDESLKAIQRGLRKTNRVDKKYYDLLKVLESRQIISSVEIKNDEAVFYNKHK